MVETPTPLESRNDVLKHKNRFMRGPLPALQTSYYTFFC